VLFAGGYTASAVVDAYNTTLTHSTPTELSQARFGMASTSLGDYALFGGGSGNGFWATVDAYDTSLVRSSSTRLNIARRELAAANVGNYALFAGGEAASNSKSKIVDTYTVV
jgi:hypothetical protein